MNQYTREGAGPWFFLRAEKRIRLTAAAELSALGTAVGEVPVPAGALPYRFVVQGAIVNGRLIGVATVAFRLPDQRAGAVNVQLPEPRDAAPPAHPKNS